MYVTLKQKPLAPIQLGVSHARVILGTLVMELTAQVGPLAHAHTQRASYMCIQCTCTVCIHKCIAICICSFSHYTDIDECAMDNGECAEICNNVEGSYYCSCNESGYEVIMINETCQGQHFVQQTNYDCLPVMCVVLYQA